MPCPRCHKFPCSCTLYPETTVPEPTKPETPARRGLDPELQTLAKIDRLLADLDPFAALRLLDYLTAKSRSRAEDTFAAGPNDRFRPIPGFGHGAGESGDR